MGPDPEGWGTSAESRRRHSREAKATRTAAVVRCHSNRLNEMPLRTNQQSVPPPQKKVEGAQRRMRLEGRDCTKSRFRWKLLILNEIMVEEAGVELIKVLRPCRFIDSKKCHNGQNGPIARSVVRLLYEKVRSRLTLTPHSAPVFHRSGRIRGERNSTAFRGFSAGSLA